MSKSVTVEYTGGSAKAKHLCVLIHGFWGNPVHLWAVAKALRNAHSEDELYLLVAKRNSGNFTYDGIETGGERVCLEIEEELEKIKSKGGNIKKISLVGYSLGGLIARYAVGLLYAKGMFNEIEPVNFTTFASPHLGVRTPLKKWHSPIFNALGSRALSASGKQLFIIDEFRDTGKPLLQFMTEPGTIFTAGLALFKRRILYCNVVNDKSAAYYTTGITKTDPYMELDKIKPNYLPGYEDVILHPLNPVSLRVVKQEAESLPLAQSALKYLRKLSYYLLVSVLLPVAITFFIFNSMYHTIRSSRRIRLHTMGLLGVNVEDYKVPLMASVNRIRAVGEGIYENVNNFQENEYLKPLDESTDEGENELSKGERETLLRERKQSQSNFPTLALAPQQFEMIRGLDSLGWRKFPVWIHATGHSHGAIIVRRDHPAYQEGQVVLSHWIKEEFQI